MFIHIACMSKYVGVQYYLKSKHRSIKSTCMFFLIRRIIKDGKLFTLTLHHCKIRMTHLVYQIGVMILKFGSKGLNV